MGMGMWSRLDAARVVMALPKLPPHEWLREYRQDKGVRQEDIERLTAAYGPRSKISQSHLSKIERGNAPLIGLGAERINALRLALGMSAEEWVENTGVQIVTAASDVTPPAPRGEVSTVLHVFKVPVICMASAGPGIKPGECDEPLAYDYVLPELYLEHMLIMQVDGNSMTSSGAVNSLDAGDWVYVDTHSLDLQEGKIFVVYVQGAGVMVKRVRHYPALGWVLTSDNASYAPIQPDDAKIIGRVYYRQPKGEKL